MSPVDVLFFLNLFHSVSDEPLIFPVAFDPVQSNRGIQPTICLEWEGVEVLPLHCAED